MNMHGVGCELQERVNADKALSAVISETAITCHDSLPACTKTSCTFFPPDQVPVLGIILS